MLKTRDHAAIGEALWIVAAAAFGGSIALIGQMYHMTGDEASAMVTWGAGTALAAVALRSNPLTVAAVGIAEAWLFAARGSTIPATPSSRISSSCMAALLLAGLLLDPQRRRRVI